MDFARPGCTILKVPALKGSISHCLITIRGFRKNSTSIFEDSAYKNYQVLSTNVAKMSIIRSIIGVHMEWENVNVEK